MREPQPLEFPRDYERPNQNWICGLAEEGTGCPGGPGPRGHCPHAVACHPVQEGDRWRCNRSESRGGPCEEGPSPTGECCHTYSCTPVRSLRGQRGRFVGACFLATLGAVVLLLSSSWRGEFLAPGELSAPHAQLLARSEEQTNRCAACHAAGVQSVGQWLTHATDSSLAQPTQSTLCLECHKRELASESALWAHNVEPQILLASHQSETQPTEVSRRVDPTRPLVCSTCHREHHGREHSLVAMTGDTCQACHRERYHSFALDHPELSGWPSSRRTRIAFDHQAHQVKHFVEEKHEYACSVCHAADASGQFQGTLPYEQSCAQCHDKKMKASWPTGLAFVSLPMLDVEALNAAGENIDNWPEAARGDFDGALPVITKFLLLGDPRGVAALEQLGADFDFFDVDPDDEEQVKVAGAAIAALQDLLSELQTQGQATIEKRLQTILQRDPTADELAAVTAHLSASDVAAFADWFAPAVEESAQEESADPDTALVAGGWLRDDATFALKYVPQGHADAWLPAWVDLIAESTRGEHGNLAAGLLGELMKPTAAGMCGSCHSIDQTEQGGLAVNWLAERPADDATPFTFFNHAPHVLQAELADCTACHRLDTEAKVMDSYQGQDPHTFAAGFHALTKQDCAECHHPGATGDDCTTCHRYHSLLPVAAE